MQITGKLTGDAVVRSPPGQESKVVRFRLALNDSYPSRGGGTVKTASFFECSYWRETASAKSLKQGTIVELCGRIGFRIWMNHLGFPKGELTFHVDHFKILGGANVVSDQPAEGFDACHETLLYDDIPALLDDPTYPGG